MEEEEGVIKKPIMIPTLNRTGKRMIETDTITSMKMEVQLVTLGEIMKENPHMKTSRDGESLKEEKEATPIMIGGTKERKVIAEAEETIIMEASGRGSEDTARGVSVSEGLL